MIARYNFRDREVTITMTPTEFTETVEWLECIADHDGATHEWRREHNRVMPRVDEHEEVDLEANGMDWYGSIS